MLRDFFYIYFFTFRCFGRFKLWFFYRGLFNNRNRIAFFFCNLRFFTNRFLNRFEFHIGVWLWHYDKILIETGDCIFAVLCSFVRFIQISYCFCYIIRNIPSLENYCIIMSSKNSKINNYVVYRNHTDKIRQE